MFGAKLNVEAASRNSRGKSKPLFEVAQCLSSGDYSIPVGHTPNTLTAL